MSTEQLTPAEVVKPLPLPTVDFSLPEAQIKRDHGDKIGSFHKGEIPAIGLKNVCDPAKLDLEWEAPNYPISKSPDLERTYQLVYDELVRQFRPKGVDSAKAMFVYRAGVAKRVNPSFHVDNHGQLLARGNMFRLHATTLGKSRNLFVKTSSPFAMEPQYEFEEQAGDASLFISLGNARGLLPTKHSFTSIDSARQYMLGEIYFTY